MAYIGLAQAIIAKLDNEKEKTYTKGFECGEAMETTITPNENAAELPGNNRIVESVKEFKNATLKIGTTRLPVEADEVIFGRKASEGGSTVYSINDVSNYVGYGCYVCEIVHNVRSFVAIWIYKCMFSEPEGGYKTKGNSIEFVTPELNGTAVTLESGEWMEKKKFASEVEAVDWLKEKAGMSEQTNAGS